MVWRLRDDRKNARTNTVCHRVVYVPAVMRRQNIPNQNSMKVSAGDIVRLNIPADVVAEVTKYIGRVPVARTQRIQRRGRSTLP